MFYGFSLQVLHLFCEIDSQDFVLFNATLSGIIFFLSFFFLFELHPQQMEVSGAGAESKLQLQPKPQLWQHQNLNPLCRAEDRT